MKANYLDLPRFQGQGNVWYKGGKRGKTILAQVSLPRANHLALNTYFLLELMNRHFVQFTWLNDLALISLNRISNRMSTRNNKAVGWRKRQILSSSEILGEEIFPYLPYLSEPHSSAVPLKLSRLSHIPASELMDGDWWILLPKCAL